MHLLPAGNNTVSNSLRHSGGMFLLVPLYFDMTTFIIIIYGVDLWKLQYIYVYNMVATK